MNIILPEEFATEAHGAQKYGDGPYIDHLSDVVLVFDEFIDYIIEGDNIYIESVFEAACWLHDVLEDTDITYKQLLTKFGIDIANLVHAVTDEPGKNRKERKAKTLPKTRACGKLAVALKLCDRIANIQSCIDSKNYGLMKMYKKENNGFRLALYLKEDEIDPMWDCLEELLKQ
jgi:(p)ppGpp synthase/HD superfamily hydrolase